jgi:hypothetical protein
MNGIELKATNLTPSVLLRPEDGTLSFIGECYPENPTVFFGPIFSALERYFRSTGAGDFEVHCELSYVNSASTKALRRLFGLLDAMGHHGTRARVLWVHEPDDETMIELGRDLTAGMHFIDYTEMSVELLAASGA